DGDLPASLHDRRAAPHWRPRQSTRLHQGSRRGMVCDGRGDSARVPRFESVDLTVSRLHLTMPWLCIGRGLRQASQRLPDQGCGKVAPGMSEVMPAEINGGSPCVFSPPGAPPPPAPFPSSSSPPPAATSF